MAMCVAASSSPHSIGRRPCDVTSLGGYDSPQTADDYLLAKLLTQLYPASRPINTPNRGLIFCDKQISNNLSCPTNSTSRDSLEAAGVEVRLVLHHFSES